MIKLNNVKIGYGNIEIVHGVSLDLPLDGSLSIIGPNGCGKTTLLRGIANLIEYSGSITFDGVEMKNMKRKDSAKKVALLTQTTNIYFPYTVFEIVSFGRYASSNSPFGRMTLEDKDIVLDAISSVGLTKEKDKMISELSGGQFQRAFLARAFAQNPDLLLLDEPTNHLDIKYQYEFLEQLDKWRQSGKKSVISVMHDINIAAEFSNNVLLMNGGKEEFFGDIKELMSGEILPRVFDMDVKGFMVRALRRWG